MLDLALAYSPVISLLAPVVTVALVAWLSRWFVPLARYERDMAERDDRLDTMAELLDRQAAELRKKPDAATVAELADAVHKLSCDVAVLGESVRALHDDVSRIGTDMAELRRVIMARSA